MHFLRIIFICPWVFVSFGVFKMSGLLNVRTCTSILAFGFSCYHYGFMFFLFVYYIGSRMDDILEWKSNFYITSIITRQIFLEISCKSYMNGIIIKSTSLCHNNIFNVWYTVLVLGDSQICALWDYQQVNQGRGIVTLWSGRSFACLFTLLFYVFFVDNKWVFHLELFDDYLLLKLL